ILEAGAPVYVPTTLSLTVGKQPDDVHATPQEEFFRLLEEDVQCINAFTTRVAVGLRSQLRKVLVGLAGGYQPQQCQQQHLQQDQQVSTYGNGTTDAEGGAVSPVVVVLPPPSGDLSDAATREHWLAVARRLGEEYLRLEKYVNLNYTGLQKILKKHDKLIPSAPCWNFYKQKVHINGQPWVRGDHHDIQLHAAAVAAGGAGYASAPTSAAAASSRGLTGTPGAVAGHHKDFTNSTFWVRLEDVALVKHVLMQHMAVQPPPTNAAAAAGAATGSAALWAECDSASADLVNCTFLDNASLELYHNLLYGRPYATTLQLRWYGSRVPETIDVIRQVHREGWRPEDCAEDSFPLQETRVADFLNGRWTWADARKLMMPEEYGIRPKQPQHQRNTSHAHHNHSHRNHPNRQPVAQTDSWPRGDAASSGAVGSSTAVATTAGTLGGGGGAGGGSSSGSSSGAGARVTSNRSGGGGGGGGSATHGLPADDPARLAKEYQLFKTFTEVARLVESKGLQPMVQMRFRNTTFREPCDEWGLKALLEEDVQMLLEYAYDTSTRLSHGLWRQEHPADAIEFPYAIFKVQRPDEAFDVPHWLRQLLQSGLLRPMNDFSKFLHACAGLLPDMVRAVPQWIDDEVIQKSLYANVMANEELQTLSPLRPLAPRALLLAGHNVVAEMEEGVREQTAAGAAAAVYVPPTRTTSAPLASAASMQPGRKTNNYSNNTNRTTAVATAAAVITPSAAPGQPGRSSKEQPQPHPGTSRSPSMPLNRPNKVSNSSSHSHRQRHQLPTNHGNTSCRRTSGDELAAAAAARGGSGAAQEGEVEGEQAVSEDSSSPLIPLLHSLQRNVSSRLGGAAAAVQAGWQAKLLQRQALQGRAYQPQLIFLDPAQSYVTSASSCSMLGFAASAHTNPFERPTVHISETTAFVLLALSIAMAGYGLGAFVWRSTRFYELHPGRFDDTAGALAMTVVITFALFSLLICNLADLMEVLGDGEGHAPGQGLAAAEARAGLRGGLGSARATASASPQKRRPPSPLLRLVYANPPHPTVSSAYPTAGGALQIAALRGQVIGHPALLVLRPESFSEQIAGPLYLAASRGHVEAVAALLAWGADPAAANCGDSESPEFIAALNGHVDVVRVLLRHGRGLVARGHTAAANGKRLQQLARETGGSRGLAMGCYCACQSACQVTGRLTVRTPPSAKEREDDTGESALMEAAAHDHSDVVSMLLAAGASPQHRSLDGETALHSAATAGCEECVRVLLEAGADPDATSDLVMSYEEVTRFSGRTFRNSAELGEWYRRQPRPTRTHLMDQAAVLGGCTPLSVAISCGWRGVAVRLLDAAEYTGKAPLSKAKADMLRGLVNLTLARGNGAMTTLLMDRLQACGAVDTNASAAASGGALTEAASAGRRVGVGIGVGAGVRSRTRRPTRAAARTAVEVSSTRNATRGNGGDGGGDGGGGGNMFDAPTELIDTAAPEVPAGDAAAAAAAATDFHCRCSLRGDAMDSRLVAVAAASTSAAAERDAGVPSASTPLAAAAATTGGSAAAASGESSDVKGGGMVVRCLLDPGQSAVGPRQRRLVVRCSGGCQLDYHYPDCWRQLETLLKAARSDYHGLKGPVGRGHGAAAAAGIPCWAPDCRGVVQSACVMEGPAEQPRFRQQLYVAPSSLAHNQNIHHNHHNHHQQAEKSGGKGQAADADAAAADEDGDDATAATAGLWSRKSENLRQKQPWRQHASVGKGGAGQAPVEDVVAAPLVGGGGGGGGGSKRSKRSAAVKLSLTDLYGKESGGPVAATAEEEEGGESVQPDGGSQRGERAAAAPPSPPPPGGGGAWRDSASVPFAVRPVWECDDAAPYNGFPASGASQGLMIAPGRSSSVEQAAISAMAGGGGAAAAAAATATPPRPSVAVTEEDFPSLVPLSLSEGPMGDKARDPIIRALQLLKVPGTDILTPHLLLEGPCLRHLYTVLFRGRSRIADVQLRAVLDRYGGMTAFQSFEDGAAVAASFRDEGTASAVAAGLGAGDAVGLMGPGSLGGSGGLEVSCLLEFPSDDTLAREIMQADRAAAGGSGFGAGGGLGGSKVYGLELGSNLRANAAPFVLAGAAKVTAAPAPAADLQPPPPRQMAAAAAPPRVAVTEVGVEVKDTERLARDDTDVRTAAAAMQAMACSTTLQAGHGVTGTCTAGSTDSTYDGNVRSDNRRPTVAPVRESAASAAGFGPGGGSHCAQVESDPWATPSAGANWLDAASSPSSSSPVNPCRDGDLRPAAAAPTVTEAAASRTASAGYPKPASPSAPTSGVAQGPAAVVAGPAASAFAAAARAFPAVAALPRMPTASAFQVAAPVVAPVAAPAVASSTAPTVRPSVPVVAAATAALRTALPVHLAAVTAAARPPPQPQMPPPAVAVAATLLQSPSAAATHAQPPLQRATPPSLMLHLLKRPQSQPPPPAASPLAPPVATTSPGLIHLATPTTASSSQGQPPSSTPCEAAATRPPSGMAAAAVAATAAVTPKSATKNVQGHQVRAAVATAGGGGGGERPINNSFLAMPWLAGRAAVQSLAPAGPLVAAAAVPPPPPAPVLTAPSVPAAAPASTGTLVAVAAPPPDMAAYVPPLELERVRVRPLLLHRSGDLLRRCYASSMRILLIRLCLLPTRMSSKPSWPPPRDCSRSAITSLLLATDMPATSNRLIYFTIELGPEYKDEHLINMQ
ncbi:hypothetical protein VOLCADRAFT_94637, partial [Volvox carteri f. nagariensis]